MNIAAILFTEDLEMRRANYAASIAVAQELSAEKRTLLRDALTTMIPLMQSSAQAYKASGLSARRFRWDALRKTGITPAMLDCPDDNWDNEHSAASAHVDLALKSIMFELHLFWASK
jgi:hypothetical protein